MAYIDIIFWLAVVVIVFLRLRSLLGTRPDSEKVIVVKKENIKEIIKVLEKVDENKIASNPLPLSATDAVLAEIPDFNKSLFLKGATRAFELIVCAFANADLETLGALTNKKIFKKFEEIILQRQKEGQTAETDFIGIQKAEIVDAKKTKNLAKIVVNFVSEQVNLLRDSSGAIVQGDENFVQKINDVWTFERDLTKNSNIWLLSSTKK